MNNVLITGASSGIGKELSFEFAKKGYDLILIARRIQNLKEIKKQIQKKYPNSKIQIMKFDLTKTTQLKKIKNKHPQIKILVNNAGFGKKEEFYKSNPETNEQMINLNITALTTLTRLYLDVLIKNQGKILNVASIASFQPGPYMNVYFATKAYVLSFSEALSEELKQKKVTVTTLCPGPTKTEFDKKAGTKFKGNIPDAKEVAKYAIKSLFKEKTIAIHPWLFKIIIQLNRILPRALTRKLASIINSKI